MGIAERIAITMMVIAKKFAMMSAPWSISARLHEFVSRVITRPPCGGQTINSWAGQQRPAQGLKQLQTMTTYVLSHRLRRAVKRLDRACLILLNIENGGQPGHLEQIVHSLVQIGEFQLPTLVPNRCVFLAQFPNCTTVHVLNLSEVQHDRFLALLRQISNNLA